MTDPQSLADAMTNGSRLDADGRIATGGTLDGKTPAEVLRDKADYESAGSRWLLSILRGTDGKK